MEISVADVVARQLSNAAFNSAAPSAATAPPVDVRKADMTIPAIKLRRLNLGCKLAVTVLPFGIVQNAMTVFASAKMDGLAPKPLVNQGCGPPSTYHWYLRRLSGTVNPMGRQRFENLEEDRQTRLFDSAAEEFSERGYEAASLNQILENSGMSKSSLYYYFDDKADLFSSLVERSVGYLWSEIGGFDLEELTAETYWSSLESHVVRAISVMSRNVWYVKLARMFLRLRGQPKGIEKTGRLHEASIRFVGGVLARGQELGVVRADLPQSVMVDCALALGEASDSWMIVHWDEMDDAAKSKLPV
jgi:AcrR family transcriptional regulator